MHTNSKHIIVDLDAYAFTRACHELKRYPHRYHIERNVALFFDSRWVKSPPTVRFQFCPTLGDAMARFRSSTFAALRLSASDQADFVKWSETENLSVSDILNQFTGDGFKISVSWIFDQNSFCLSVIGTDETKDHRDMVMTSWSDDLEDVCRVAAYKHYVVCEAKAWPTDEPGKRWG